MEMRPILQQLGLSAPESDLYLLLNRTPGISARDLAASIGIKRTSVYAMLDRLCEKGFAQQHVTKDGRTYVAERPQHVRRMQEKKIAQFTSLIPLLESQAAQQTIPSSVRFFETRQELKQWYLELLEDYAGKSYRIIGTQKDWYRTDPQFLENIHRIFKEKRIKAQILFSADSPRTAQGSEARIYENVRYLPADCTFRTTIDIFDDRILLVSPEQRAAAIVIQIPAMLDVFDALFRSLWKTAKKS